MIGSGFRRWRRGWGIALVALGKEPECVNLLHKVGHASPSAEPEAHHQNPDHDEDVHHVHGRPAGQENRRLLCCVLQLSQEIQY
ncbi:hypothetical protein RHGRI_015419 [Rhododendron griersonianum]|uniref:Secreted protein n=1 Tax=Rhododendron griersonianum TaxID=479676 RepID=A0AAV6KD73_9ERIC|nr:hypothetical protein RHGRI_015419 [Rhododendron griersonianum]